MDVLFSRYVIRRPLGAQLGSKHDHPPIMWRSSAALQVLSNPAQSQSAHNTDNHYLAM